MRPYVFAFEIQVPYGAGGQAQTHYVSTGAFITGAADTPPSTTFRELVADPGGVQRSVFKGDRTAGLVSPTKGDVVLINTGEFDPWLDYGTDGGIVTCRYGRKGGAYPTDFQTVFVARIAGSPLVNYRTMTLRLRSPEWMLDQQIVTAGFDGDGDLEGEAIAKGQLQQLVLGRPAPFVPILLDPVLRLYFVAANAPANYDRLYYGDDQPDYVPHDGGVPLLANGTYSDETSLLNDPTPNVGGQYMHWVANSGAGPVYLRLASKIKRELRYWFDGRLIPSGANSPSDPARRWNVFDLAQRAGTGADPDDIPEGSEAIDAGNRLIVAQTYREVLDDIAAFEFASIGFDLRGQFYAKRITPSWGGDDPYALDGFTFVDGGNSRQWDASPIPGLSSRVWRINVFAGATTPGAIAKPDASDTYRLEIAEILRRQGWMTRFTASIPSIKAEDPGAIEIDLQIVGNEFTDEASMEAFAEDFFSLYGARTFSLTLEADFTTETLQLDLLDRVYVSSARLGCTPPRTCRIVGIDYRLSNPPTMIVRLASQAVQSMTGLVLENVGPVGEELYIPPVSLPFNVSGSPSAAIATGLAKTWYAEQDFRLERIAASVGTVQDSGSVLTIDVKVNDVSVFSTLLTIDNTEAKSSTATTPAVLDQTKVEIVAGDKVTFHVTQVGDGTAKELTVTLIGYPG
jgi:hypothetical protein